MGKEENRTQMDGTLLNISTNMDHGATRLSLLSSLIFGDQVNQVRKQRVSLNGVEWGSK